MTKIINLKKKFFFDNKFFCYVIYYKTIKKKFFFDNKFFVI